MSDCPTCHGDPQTLNARIALNDGICPDCSDAPDISMASVPHDDPSRGSQSLPGASESSTIPPSREIPLGMVEIATLLGVKRTTPQTWRARGLLPEPDGYVSGIPVWFRETVVSWAQKTGRLSEV